MGAVFLTRRIVDVGLGFALVLVGQNFWICPLVVELLLGDVGVLLVVYGIGGFEIVGQ